MICVCFYAVCCMFVGGYVVFEMFGMLCLCICGTLCFSSFCRLCVCVRCCVCVSVVCCVCVFCVVVCVVCFVWAYSGYWTLGGESPLDWPYLAPRKLSRFEKFILISLNQ